MQIIDDEFKRKVTKHSGLDVFAVLGDREELNWEYTPASPPGTPCNLSSCQVLGPYVEQDCGLRKPLPHAECIDTICTKLSIGCSSTKGGKHGATTSSIDGH